MSRHRRVVALLICAVLAGVLAVKLNRSDEPSYGGRDLSEWVMRFHWDQPEKTRLEAGEAIRQIGTNAIPSLFEAIQYEAPPWKKKLRRWISRFSGGSANSERWMSWPEQRADMAKGAFVHLGPAAESAIPELVGLLNDPQRSYTASRASSVLGFIGKPALEPLINVATTGAIPARCLALRSLGGLNSNAVPAIALLIERLGDSNATVAASAAIALGQIKSEPARVVPALTTAFGDPRPWVSSFSARALVDFGRDARSAVPVLVEALSATNADTRNIATNTLRYIAPEVLTNAPPR